MQIHRHTGLFSLHKAPISQLCCLLILLIHQKRSWHSGVMTEKSLTSLADGLENRARNASHQVSLHLFHSEALTKHISLSLHNTGAKKKSASSQLYLISEDKGPQFTFAGEDHKQGSTHIKGNSHEGHRNQQQAGAALSHARCCIQMCTLLSYLHPDV